MQKTLFTARDTLRSHALFLGEEINLQTLKNHHQSLATLPLTIPAGKHGCAVLLGYGAVVLFGLELAEEAAFLTELSPLVSGQFANPETESALLHIKLTETERVKEGGILLHEFSIERLQIVADILAKSVVLSHYETSLASVFDQIEPFAASLQRDNLLWESPALESLYRRLEDEYEIRERHSALERKLELISRTAETVLEFMQHRTSLRVEWYVVILIVLEILLSVYNIVLES